MAFGVLLATPAATLRNFLTFTMREMFESQEKKAYYNDKGMFNMRDFKIKYNWKIKKYVQLSFSSSERSGGLDTFETFFCVNNALCTFNDDYQVSVAEPFPGLTT